MPSRPIKAAKRRKLTSKDIRGSRPAERAGVAAAMNITPGHPKWPSDDQELHGQHLPINVPPNSFVHLASMYYEVALSCYSILSSRAVAISSCLNFDPVPQPASPDSDNVVNQLHTSKRTRCVGDVATSYGPSPKRSCITLSSSEPLNTDTTITHFEEHTSNQDIVSPPLP